MTEVIELLGVGALGYLLAEAAEPVQHLKTIARIDRWPAWAQTLAGCPLCLTFWIGLAYYRDPVMASAASVAAEAISRWMHKNNTL